MVDRRAHERINSLETVLVDMRKKHEVLETMLVENTELTKSNIEKIDKNHEVLETINDAMQLFRWINNAISWISKRLFKLSVWGSSIVGFWLMIKDYFKGH